MLVSFRGKRVHRRPKVSIVTPCMNSRRFLKAALDSVERTAQAVALEHVVADGGSTDGSVELLRDAACVTGVSQPDGGLYDALNWAISAARGDYVQLLNADDELEPSFVERAAKLLDGYDELDAIVGDTVFVDERGLEKERWSTDLSYALDLGRQAEGHFFNINSALFRSTFLERVGRFDQANFPIGADRDLELRMVVAGLRAISIPQPAYRFRVHHDSLTVGEGGRLRNQSENARLFDKWSRSTDVPGRDRVRFAVRSKELFLGLGLKQLRSRRTFGAGARLLAKHLSYRPHRVPAALFVWVRHRLRGDEVPMLVGGPSPATTDVDNLDSAPDAGVRTDRGR